MDFLNNKIIKTGLVVGVILLPVVFYYHEGSAATTIDDAIMDSTKKTQSALNNAVSFFISTGETIPNAPLRVSATSYSFDLLGSEVTWTVNGRIFKRGVGEKVIEVMLGDAGSSTKIEIDAETVSGQTYHKEITVIPATIDLVWQAQTYTPAWYKGKPLPSSTSETKIIAIPYFKESNGDLMPASDLVYKWNLNYKNITTASGYGKSSFLITMPQLMYEAKVEVEVATRDRSIVRKSSVKLISEETKPIIYENHPTKGVEYSSALTKKINMEDDALNIKVEPFFFASKDLRSIVYEWVANRKKIEGTEKLNNIVFTRQSGDKGSTNISIKTKNVRDFLQTAQSNFLIDFDN